MTTWVWEKYPERVELLLELDDITDDVKVAGGFTTCIKCAMPMAVCSYCYTEHVFSWIRTNLPDLADEFHTLFRYGNDKEWHTTIPDQQPKKAVVSA